MGRNGTPCQPRSSSTHRTQCGISSISMLQEFAIGRHPRRHGPEGIPNRLGADAKMVLESFFHNAFRLEKSRCHRLRPPINQSSVHRSNDCHHGLGFEIMSLPTHEPLPVKHAQKRSRKLSKVLIVFCLLVAAGIWILSQFNDPLKTAKLENTNICGNGNYSLQTFTYRNGDGYVQLIDQAGRVHGQSYFSEGTDLGPIWSDDCKQVSVNTDKDPASLSVQP